MPFLQYAKYVAQSGYNLNMMATRMTFDTDSDFPKLTFSNTEFLDSDGYADAVDQGESPIAVNAGKLNFSPKKESFIPKMVAPPGSAAARLAAPVAEDTPPVKRAEKPKETPKPKSGGMASMVDEWGDEK
jgi:hypothetical protein